MSNENVKSANSFRQSLGIFSTSCSEFVLMKSSSQQSDAKFTYFRIFTQPVGVMVSNRSNSLKLLFAYTLVFSNKSRAKNQFILMQKNSTKAIAFVNLKGGYELNG